MKEEDIRNFEVYPFISRLFEDLEATLPALGGEFRGIVTPMEILVRGDQNKLKNSLFMVFYDWAQLEKKLWIKFSLAGAGLEVHLCFLPHAPLENPLGIETLEHWGALGAQVMESPQGNGFYIKLEAGPEKEGTLPWDRQAMLEFYSGDPAWETLVQAFPGRAKALVEELETALAQGNVASALRASHSLKGAARGIFAMPLSHRSHLMEMACRAGDLSRGEELFKEIRSAYLQLLVFWENSP